MAQEKICGIYKIVNKINGKVYIGSSCNLKRRFSQHKHLLKTGEHDNKELQQDYNEFKEEHFEYVIIEEHSIKISKKDLEKREQFYLNHEKNKYNVSPTAGSNLGAKRSQKWCQEWSKNHPLKGKIGKDCFNSIPIWQYGLDGVFVRHWDSIMSVVRELEISPGGLSKAIIKNGTYVGFQWFREYQGNRVEPRIRNNVIKYCQPVGMFNKQSNKLIKVFRRTKEISFYFNWNQVRSVKSICLHTKSREYNWKYISNEEYNQNIHLAFQPEES